MEELILFALSAHLGPAKSSRSIEIRGRATSLCMARHVRFILSFNESGLMVLIMKVRITMVHEDDIKRSIMGG